jgi:hypothetical protein
MKVDEKYFDEVFDFAGQWDMPSKCGLKLGKYEDKAVILVTELYQNNPGTSVTYAAGSLIKQICDAKKLDINNIIYIECNPDTSSKLSFYDEECFAVSFDQKDGIPMNLKYRQLSSEELSKYITF